MSKRKNPSTSVRAYHSVKNTPMLGEHHKKIINALKVLRTGTSEEIAKHLRMDKSQVYRRMDELVKAGEVMHTGGERKTSSGRFATVYELVNAPTDLGKPPKKEVKKETVITPTLFP